MGNENEHLDKKKKGRDILSLRVDEVSPVDRPANLQEFIVIKRQESQEDSMGAFDSDQDGTVTNDVGYQWIEVDLEKRLEPDLVSATKPATEFLEAVEKGESKLSEELVKELPADLKSAITRVLAFLGKVAGGQYPYPKPAGKADEEEKKTQKAITDVADWTEDEKVSKQLPADLKTAITRVMTFLRKVAAGTYPYPKPAAKQGDQGGSTTDTPAKKQDDLRSDEEVDVEKRVHAYLEDIFKGKRFTDARKEGIATMAKQALALLAEVDAEAVKAIITDKVKALKGEIKWTEPAASSGSADVKKEIEEAVSKALAPLKEQMQETSEKVEQIVKTREAPKSGGSESTDRAGGGKTESKWKGAVPIPQ